MTSTIPFSTLLAIMLVIVPLSSCGPVSEPPGGTPVDLRGGISTLKLKNKLYTAVMVRLEGPEIREITVPARSTETIQLKSGVYQYIAGARDFQPISRYKALEPNRTHTVYF